MCGGELYPPLSLCSLNPSMTGAVCEGVAALSELDPNLHFIKKYAAGSQCCSHFVGWAPWMVCLCSIDNMIEPRRICLAENTQAGM